MTPRASVLGVLLMAGSTAIGQTGGTPKAPPVAPIVVGLYPPGAARGETVEWTLTGRGFSKAKKVLGLGKGIEVLDFKPVGDTQAKLEIRVAADAPLGFREIRVEGPDGVSNLVPARIDQLRQVLEQEPNDDPAKAQEVGVGTAFVGVIRSTDLDHVRIKGTPGRRVTLDLETRRLGNSISPVLTAMNSGGRSIVQAREVPGGDRDCRTVAVIPPDGILLVSIRDNVYGGSETAAYRLRIDPTPAASGLFPLGGPKGAEIDVEVSGGTMPSPLTKRVKLPNRVEPEFDLGQFEGPDGAVAAPMRFVVGDDNEIIEPKTGASDSPLPIKLGTTVNGRIGRSEEVDRFSLSVKKGERFRVKVQAAELGSWIDSVVTVRGEGGEVLAENDDEGNAGAGAQGRRVNALGLTEGKQDSVLDFNPTKDGKVTVEITDRYGEGGPAYAYRLAVGRSRPDFSITMLLGNPNAAPANQPQVVSNLRLAPGMMGVFNLQPGSVTPINFVLNAEGTPGVVTVSAEGLPQGVTVEPVKVDMSAELRPGDPPNRSAADALVFRVSRFADAGTSEIKIVGRSQPKGGEPIERRGVGTVGLQLSNTGGQALPTLRTVSTFPLRVLGENQFRLVGPVQPPSLVSVTAPGVLLLGDRIDLPLEFDQSPLADPGFEFEAKVDGVGLATNTVISSGQTVGEESPPSDVVVRVLASPKAEPGVYKVTVQTKYSGDRTEERSVFVIVRKPLELLHRGEALKLKPGASVELPVLVRRQPGCDGEIEIKVEDLPRGVKLAGDLVLAEGQSEGVLKLEMAAGARALRSPREIKIVAVARMPRGSVSVESPVRPMIEPAAAEE